MPSSETGSNPTVAIAATFTAEPLSPTLRLVLEEAGLKLFLQFAPYNQLFQELLSPASLLATNASGVNVILLRVQDFVREIGDLSEAPSLINRIGSELGASLRQYATRAKVPTLFLVLPSSQSVAAAMVPAIDEATAALLACARTLPGFTIVSSGELEFPSEAEQYDAVSDELAHVPYSEEYYASLSLTIARKIHALRTPPQKVLILDCDETLWRGVLGEDGIDGVSIPRSFSRLQQFAVNIQAQGILIGLLSKNSERDVLELFEKRADMLLKLDHIVTHRINWEPKPRNIASIARELNLGLDSFVFIDDNPVECAMMRAELPQIITLDLPPDDEIESFLSNLWMFDKLKITDEDIRRTSMYRENAARQEFEDSATDIAQFIASLGLVIDIDAPQENEWSRAGQLTQRTNQFNFTTVRRTEAELRALQNDGAHVLRIKVSDRFGDYGFVGLVIANQASDALVVDTFLLSCRVLGRGVEHAILNRLGELAQQHSLPFVSLKYLLTSKNEPARAFAESVAAQFRTQEHDDRIDYRIPPDAARAVSHRPGHDPAAVIEARRSDESRSSMPLASKSSKQRSERYNKLARVLISGRRVLEAARAEAMRPRKLTETPSAPVTDTQRALLILWQDLLGVAGLGVDDDYFDVGGTSLIAVRLFSEISRRFGVRLPLTTILRSRTVRALASQVDSRFSPDSEKLTPLKPGGPRNLFLVHDGDGETLLYLNVARHLPDDIGVFGLEPRRVPGIPLAHASIEDMASYYVREARKIQPHGPYLLGGMCAGGVIAYEMAVQLLGLGERIEFVCVLDAAVPRAAKRSGLIAKQRLTSLKSVIFNARSEDLTRGQHVVAIAGTILQKIYNTLTWEIFQRSRTFIVWARFELLRYLLARKVEWPSYVPELSARQIYDSAEARYVPKSRPVPVVLVRAREGTGEDTPYQSIYSDETFGWKAIVPSLTIVDTDGGHSSMLQEPFARRLADELMPHLTTKPATRRMYSLEAAEA